MKEYTQAAPTTEWYSWFFDEKTKKVQIPGFTCYLSVGVHRRNKGERYYVLIKNNAGLIRVDGTSTGEIIYMEKTFGELMLKIERGNIPVTKNVPVKCDHLNAKYYERFNVYFCWKCKTLISGTQAVRKLFYNILYKQQNR